MCGQIEKKGVLCTRKMDPIGLKQKMLPTVRKNLTSFGFISAMATSSNTRSKPKKQSKSHTTNKWWNTSTPTNRLWQTPKKPNSSTSTTNKAWRPRSTWPATSSWTRTSSHISGMARMSSTSQLMTRLLSRRPMEKVLL